MSYVFSETVTIDHTKIPNTNQTDFPMLFSGTYANLANVLNGGKVFNSSGFDIIFTSDAGGLTKLDHEIQTYTSTTGALNFWVRVPTVSHTVDTVIYLFYGNAAIVSSQENVTGVWDTNFKGVWHFKDGATLSVADSTSNANNGTNHGATATSGNFDGAAGFVAINQQYVSRASNSGLNLTSSFTVDAWLNPSSTGTFSMTAKDANTAGNREWGFWLVTTKLYFECSNEGNSMQFTGTANTTLSVGTWYKGTVTYNGTNISIFLNGAADFTPAGFTGPVFSSTAELDIGVRSGAEAQFFFNGKLQELRISKGIARTADWSKSEYNNQSNPGTFYTVGTQFITIEPELKRHLLRPITAAVNLAMLN